MLNNKSIHGYKIIADIHNLFGVLLSPGTLYPLLYRLESEGLISVEEDQRRKLYTLTPKGLKTTKDYVIAYRRNVDQIIQFIKQNISEYS
jgi:DNA-binding PadR family transcriptional regulator